MAKFSYAQLFNGVIGVFVSSRRSFRSRRFVAGATDSALMMYTLCTHVPIHSFRVLSLFCTSRALFMELAMLGLRTSRSTVQIHHFCLWLSLLFFQRSPNRNPPTYTTNILPFPNSIHHKNKNWIIFLVLRLPRFRWQSPHLLRIPEKYPDAYRQSHVATVENIAASPVWALNKSNCGFRFSAFLRSQNVPFPCLLSISSPMFRLFSSRRRIIDKVFPVAAGCRRKFDVNGAKAKKWYAVEKNSESWHWNKMIYNSVCWIGFCGNIKPPPVINKEIVMILR